MSTEFDRELLQVVLPGTIHSIENLVKLEALNNNPHYQDGITVSYVVLCAHAAELVLKYKLQYDGKPFKRIHDLYCLYQPLSDESKVAIQREFDWLISKTPVETYSGLFDKWDSAESVFRSARDIYVKWRYIVEKVPNPCGVDPFALYTAVRSVLRTTDLSYMPSIQP